MRRYHLSSMKDGWFVGDFVPSVLRDNRFEVGLKHHKKGSHWGAHYQKVAIEINLLVSGRMSICGETVYSGDIFVVEPNEVAAPEFHEDCVVVVVKVPSLPDDKVEVPQ